MDSIRSDISSRKSTGFLGVDKMLKSILNEVYSSQVFSKTDISKNLNISEEMIDSAMDQLVTMGYVIEDMGSPICESKCRSCAYSRCSTIPIKMFTITDKGKRVLIKN